MVARGDADALVSGVNMHYPETIRPALQVIGAHPKAGLVSGMYMLVFEKHVVFCADTTVNIDPTAEQLAQIAYRGGRDRAHVRHRAAHRDALVLELRLGAASGGGEGGARGAAAACSATRRSSSTARCRPTRRSTRRSCARDYPFSTLKEQANVLIFPNLSAGNIAYKLLHHLGGATAIGPILVGMSRPVHVLERGADVQDIVNMAAVAVVDAQERTAAERRRDACASTATAPHSDGLLEVMIVWRLRRSRSDDGSSVQGSVGLERAGARARRARCTGTSSRPC